MQQEIAYKVILLGGYQLRRIVNRTFATFCIAIRIPH